MVGLSNLSFKFKITLLGHMYFVGSKFGVHGWSYVCKHGLTVWYLLSEKSSFCVSCNMQIVIIMYNVDNALGCTE